MSDFIAALLMYDWPERRAEVDAEWVGLRDRLRAAGVNAPEALVRRNADMPAVPGGIKDAHGKVTAPDPARLPPDEMDFHVLWRHPKLLFAQTCWGPMELGLADDVELIGQPDYSALEGGQGAFYSSAIVMRRGATDRVVAAPAAGQPLIPLDLLRGKRFAYNGTDSMSGVVAITRDLQALGEGPALFSARLESGGHRNSIVMVAAGEADVAAIDCRSWALAQRFEPASRHVAPIGWTGLRKGLPFIMAKPLAALRPAIAAALADLRMMIV